MSTIVVTHLDDLSNANMYDLMIQGVRDQFLNPTARIVLRLSDTIDPDNNIDRLYLLQRIYHNIILEDLKRLRLRRETPDILKSDYQNHITDRGISRDSGNFLDYKLDNPFDQAMYQNMLDEIIDPATRKNLLVFVEQDIMNQMALIPTETNKRSDNLDGVRHIRRHRSLKRNQNLLKNPEIKFRKEIERYKQKTIKYSDIHQNPKAKIVSKLYNIPIERLRFNQLKYYYTRTEFQYNPFDRVREISTKIDQFDYIEAIRNLSNYMGTESYYSKLLQNPSFMSAFKTGEKIRIDQLNLDQSLQDFVALSYVKYMPKSFIITVWGPGFPHMSELVKKLEMDGIVYYVREYDLNSKTLEGLMFWLYNDFSMEKRREFITKKLEYVKVSESNKVGVIVFDNQSHQPISGQGARYKTEIRNLLLERIKSDSKYMGEEYRGNDLVHINDFHYQTVEYAQIYFNQNTLKYLEVQDRSLYLLESNERSNLILQTLRSFMYQNLDYREMDRLITFGSMVLYALGIRRNTDIDAAIIPIKNEDSDSDFVKMIDTLFSDPKTKFPFADIGIPSSTLWKNRWTERNVEWFNAMINGPKSLTEFATDPAYHFYFQGIKVCLIEHDIVKKIMRGEAHDMLDLIVIQNFLKTANSKDFEFNIDDYYSIKSDSEISKLKPLDNPIEFSSKMKHAFNIHGKTWATLGKTDDLQKLSELLNSILIKRYDSEQIKRIKDLAAFKHLYPNYSK